MVDERPVHPVAEGLEGSDAEQSWLLLAQVLVGPPPERVFRKDSRGDLKMKIEKNKKEGSLLGSRGYMKSIIQLGWGKATLKNLVSWMKL